MKATRVTMKLAVALLAGAGLVAACAALARVPDLARAPVPSLLLYAGAFACYALGACALHAARGRGALLLVLAVAGAARLALLPAPPTLSTDAYRYVWDARVASAGISPYAHPPEAPALAHLRDAEIYPRLNHPGWRTIYPPGAQAFFRAVYTLRPDNVLAMKTAVGLLEAVGVATLIGLLGMLGISPVRAVIYAWNPLVLLEGWGSAHLDAMVVPAVVGAVWAQMAGRHALAGGLLAAGTLLKLYPAALLPLLLGPGALPALGAFAAVLALGYAPAAGGGLSVLGSLPRYLTEEYFNPGLLRSLVDVPGLSVAALATWVLWQGTRRREAPLPARALAVIGGYLLLSPNLFPWYALWLVPFLAAVPSLPWIAFTGSVAMAYTFFLQEPWAIPWWARVVEAAPLLAGAAWWLHRRRPAARLAEGSA
ncbi:MAG: hypothetical protein A3K12_12925 [Candidatus Rokubacteria bacterium RIFCSPLOWO2_12_FULL_71_19]|nr:MAG: hypothetical protein A3K12_12925 [Candidatus Rokubacteria bacterium RIFCSPLOWO2_12_FULL_71_19]